MLLTTHIRTRVRHSQAEVLADGWTSVHADGSRAVEPRGWKGPQPGRLSTSASGVAFQDEYEYGTMCADRAKNGFNSGMGEIFRKVASISPVQTAPAPAAAAAEATALPAPSTASSTATTSDELAAYEVSASAAKVSPSP